MTSANQELGLGRPAVPDGSRRRPGVLAAYLRASRPAAGSSVNRRIFLAMLTVAGASGVVKLVSMAKEIAVAGQFGASDEMDAFVIAFALPSFIISVISSAFQAAVIPTYIQLRDTESPTVARELLSRLVFWSGALLLGLTAVLILAGPAILHLVGADFAAEKLWLTTSVYRLLLPLVLLGGITAIWGAALNAEERFIAVAAVPMATPLAILLLILTVARTIGVYALVLGMLAGAVVELVILGWIVHRRGLWVVPCWSGQSAVTRSVLRQFAVMCAGAVLMSSTALVDQSMAATLGPGSVAVLNYGNRLVLFLLGFCSMALSTAVLPHFSGMVALRDWKGINDTLRTYLCWIALATVPLTALLIWFSVPITRVVFQRGAFTSETTAIVGSVQALYLLQVPVYMMGILLVRLISALKANHMLMWGSAVSVVVNVALNYLFMQWMGVRGIALATAIVYIVSFCYLWFVVRRLLEGVQADAALDRTA